LFRVPTDAGRRQHIICSAIIDDLPSPHDGNALRGTSHKRKIVSDEQQRKRTLALKCQQFVDNRGLYRNVESRGDLVAYQHLRIADQRSSDCHSLTFTSRELVGVLLGHASRQRDALKRGSHLAINIASR
jgi:hypothetical protein